MNKPFLFSDQFNKDIKYLKKQDAKLLIKLWELIIDIQNNPISGIGQPEALKHNMSGYWSRRINSEHRLIYKITPTAIHCISCLGHY